MTINAVDLLEHVIKPTLDYLAVDSDAAEQLLLGTAAQGSDFDPFCHRRRGLGLYQITAKQHRNAWDNYLAYRPDLASRVRGLASQHQFLKNPDQELTTNLAYSTAIAWIIYLQSESQLPAADDADGLSHFWESNFCQQQNNTDGLAQHFAQWIRNNNVSTQAISP
jgi:hypothetical protein